MDLKPQEPTESVFTSIIFTSWKSKTHTIVEDKNVTTYTIYNQVEWWAEW